MSKIPGVPKKVWCNKLKCYSQILCGECAEKKKDFAYFVLYRFGGKLIEILKHSCKDLFMWTEMPIV